MQDSSECGIVAVVIMAASAIMAVVIVGVSAITAVIIAVVSAIALAIAVPVMPCLDVSYFLQYMNVTKNLHPC